MVTPTTDAWIPDYLAKVGPLAEKHGGKYLARCASVEQLEGPGPVPAVIVIVEWTSKEAERAFYSDPAYQSPLAARLAGSESTFFSVDDKDAFAS